MKGQPTKHRAAEWQERLFGSGGGCICSVVEEPCPECANGRLLKPSGEVLDSAQTIKQAKLESGDVLTLQVNRQVQLQATKPGIDGTAFAAILVDGSVVAWGWGVGVMVVAIAAGFRKGCEMCNRSKLHHKHLLQSWVMDPWSLGVSPTPVATAVRSSIS